MPRASPSSTPTRTEQTGRGREGKCRPSGPDLHVDEHARRDPRCGRRSSSDESLAPAYSFV